MVISRIVYGFIVHLVPVHQSNVTTGYRMIESETEQEIGIIDLQEYQSRKAYGLEFGTYQNRLLCQWFGYCVASLASTSYDYPTSFVPNISVPVSKPIQDLAARLKIEPRWYLVQELLD